MTKFLYLSQLAGMREMFQSELLRIEQAQNEATKVEISAVERANAAASKAAVARLGALIGNGAPLAPGLNAMSEIGIEVPAALAKFSETGVSTLSELQRNFPPLARKALAASVAEAAKNGETGKFLAFIKSQLGARSLEPHEGDDADAILSRAEAALAEGDIQESLTEISKLSDTGLSAMAGWIEAAKSHVDANKLFTELSESINN